MDPAACGSRIPGMVPRERARLPLARAERRMRGLRSFRLAILACVATFLLLVAGGLVKPTGSSLACPDWPLCNGTAFPEMAGGVRFEHSHRLAALLVVVLTSWLAWRVRKDGAARRVRVMTTALLAMIAVQAGLGALTVILKLPAPVSTAHLALSTIFFMSMMTCAHWLAQDDAPRRVELGPRRDLALFALGAVFGQILLGGFIRHTGAGRACGMEFPLCGGEWWPELWAARAHQVHRFAGFVVTLIVLAAAIPTARAAHRAGRKLARAAALLAPFLAASQIVLGIVTVTSGIAVPQVMAHFVVAILLLACWHVAWMGLGARWVPESRPRPEPHGAMRTA